MINILLVEDNPDFADALRYMLGEVSSEAFELKHASRVGDALALLSSNTFDVILLDLSLPDSDGYQTFAVIHEKANEVPIVVMTANDDQTLAVRTVRDGAQDYLVKGDESSKPLVRAIHYAIERQKAQLRLQNLSLIDELTGLYNRRGFMKFAGQQIKLANRTNIKWMLIFADVDGMKHINDTYGHVEGDHALKLVANLLRATFRESDIIARIGGDEFAILAMPLADAGADTVSARVQKAMQEYNLAYPRKYSLSISLGMIPFNPDSQHPVEDVLARADALMYEQKRRKKAAGSADAPTVP